MVGVNCGICGVLFFARLRTGGKMPRFCSRACLNKHRVISAVRGDKHPSYKGELAGYDAKHVWVRSELGAPTKCWLCGIVGLKRRCYHWANLSEEYKRTASDWIRLCDSCHKKFDTGLIGIQIDGFTWVRPLIYKSSAGISEEHVGNYTRYRARTNVFGKKVVGPSFKNKALALADYKRLLNSFNPKIHTLSHRPNN